MMAEDHRQRRATMAAESLLSASLQSQRSYTQRSISSINRTPDDMPSEDLIAGARSNGRISNVRRFFCLLVTFDLIFAALVWLICTMITGESLKTAFEEQVVHYRLTTSLFDIVMAAACRFTVLLLFYALLHFNHWFIIALSTTLTCGFLIAKVSFFDWSQISQPAFQGFLIITSFILAWGEAWFFDFRVIPQETAARDWLLGSALDPERAPLIRHIVDDPMGRVENPGNYFTPMDSPTHSDDDYDGHSEIGISAGSVENWSSDIPSMARLTNQMGSSRITGNKKKKKTLDKYTAGEDPHIVLNVLFGQDREIIRRFLFGALELTRDRVEEDWSRGVREIIQDRDYVDSCEETPVEEYKNKASDLIKRSYELLTSDKWTTIKTTTNGDTISTMNCNHGKIMKIEGVIDAPANQLLDCLYENVEETPAWNKHVTEMKRMQTIDKDTDIVYQSTKSHGGGIITPRDFITLRHRGSHGSYYISSGVSIHCPSIPSRKNFVRGENGLVCWATETLEKSDDEGTPGKCRFTWILNTNLKGWIPRSVIDKSLTIALTEFMGFLRNHVRELTDVTA